MCNHIFHHTDDRVNDYQHYGLDAVQSCSKYPDMGAQVGATQSASIGGGAYHMISHDLPFR